MKFSGLKLSSLNYIRLRCYASAQDHTLQGNIGNRTGLQCNTRNKGRRFMHTKEGRVCVLYSAAMNVVQYMMFVSRR